MNKPRKNVSNIAGKIPPAAPGLPLIGNAVDLLRDPLDFFRRMYQELGPVYSVGAPGRRYIVLAGPEANRRFADWEDSYLVSGPVYRPYQEDLGTDEVLIALDGEAHRHYRRQLRPGFSREAMTPHLPQMVAAVDEFLARQPAGSRLNVTQALQFLVAQQAGLALAGCPLDDHLEDMQRFAPTFLGAGVGSFPGVMRYFPRYRRARGRVLHFLRRVIEQHRRQPPNGRLPDLIDLLLNINTADGQPLTEQAILAKAHTPYSNTLIYVASTCGFMLYELLSQPDLLEKVRAEIDTLFVAGLPTPTQLRQSRWLRGTVLETQRMHPISLSIPRYVHHSFEFEGYLIPAGSLTLTATAVTHFLPQFFPNPDTFDPARFNPPRSEHRQGRGVLTPYGLGPHVCLSAGLVDMLIMLTIGRLLHQVELALDPPDYELGLSVAPFPAPSPDFTVRLVQTRLTRPAPLPAASFEAELADLLPDVAEATLAQTAAQAIIRQFAPGEAIIRQGEAATTFYMITAGEVAIVKESGTAQSQIVARLGEGDYFGEIGLLHGVPRTATVRAETAVKTIALEREAFTRLVAEADLTSQEIATVIRRRLISTTLAVALPQLPREQINTLLPQCQWLTAAPGSTIVRQGEAADRFYMIVRGEVEVVNGRNDGQEFVLCTLGEGDYFGEIGLLQGRPRNATVRVAAGAGEVELIALERDDFLALMAGSEATEQQVALQMAQRLYELAADATAD
jgi:cytochrome P450/CRP-like cAMP-binding protein